VPSLALVVLARDEERGLPMTVASVRGLVDEIVVAVDSRTTDGTRAAAPGALVFDLEFADFAQARNEALRRARADWILMLDADETLEGDPRPLLARPAIWEFPRRHWRDLQRTVPAEDDRFYPDRQARLFPNAPGVFFERPVHELVRGFRRRFTDSVVIHHFKEALRQRETLEERRLLYRALAERGRAEGFRFREGKDL
jgi:glycosyltransferase involved in cell wall biosynthesis